VTNVFEEATTTELLNLPASKDVVARFAGMKDLSAFDNNKEALGRLVDAMLKLVSVPSSLSEYSLDQVHHAAEMVRWCVIKDHSPYDDILADMGLDDWGP